MDLQELLIKSTVKIGSHNLFNYGTGFYISEDTILTCYHCIKEYSCSRIPIFVNNKEGVAIYIESPLSEQYDIALLTTELKNKFAVYLEEGIKPNDAVSIFGYTDDNPNGATTGLEYEGPSFSKGNIKLLKFRNGNIRKGHSGSPIFNVKTGTIVGLIRETSHPNYPIGGYGIPLKNIYDCYEEIIKINTSFNLKNNQWRNLNKVQTGIGFYDKTISNDHFELFFTGIKLDEIFIEPNYKRIKYCDEKVIELPKTNDIIFDSLDILNRTKFLFILGAFGTGKTILTKSIQHNLISKGEKTVYFRCSDIGSIIDYFQFYNLINNLKPDASNLYCFFDGYDELNLLNKDRYELIGTFLKNLIQLSKEHDIYVIVNSRNIPKNENEVYLSVSMQFEELRNSSIEYLTLFEFTNDQITSYLDAFSNAMGKRKMEERLYIKDIKKLHKNLKEACYNPLFLFCLNSAFYERGNYRYKELYDIYESFVHKTISGKFSDDTNPDNPAIHEIKAKYKYFLRRLSSEILIRNRHIDFDREQIYELYLDRNDKSYYIDNNRISDEIQKIATEILSDDIRNNISKSRLRENVLSCYFLDWNEHSWRLKDNNLLFFLVAEGYYDKLYSVLKEYIAHLKSTDRTPFESEAEFYDKLYDSFIYEKTIPLHPLTLEFLFQKIDNLETNEKECLWGFIKSLIDNEGILKINEVNIKKLDVHKLNIDIILLLIFKKINTAGYDEIDLVYFFKRYYWFISAAKIIDRNYLYLAQRFFKKSNIKGVELRRINFDGYNFDYSKLKNVHFIQNKFHESRMNNCELDRVTFTLCDLSDFDFSYFSGNVLFSNCIIEKLYIKNPKSSNSMSSIKFKNCQIKWLELHSSEKNISHTIDIEFVGSDLGTIIFDKTLFNDFILRNCIYSSINVDIQYIKNYKIENCQKK